MDIIKIHNSTSHIKANKYACMPKNIIGHMKLTKSCSQYTNGICPEVSRIDPALMPMSKNKIVHTIGNAAEGGVKNGFETESNVLKPSFTKNADSPPIARAIIA